jgi:hypothetical protein
MRRTLNDTPRAVVITIDNQDREDHAAWTARVTVDDEEVIDATIGNTPSNALSILTQALEQSGDLDDQPDPMPEDAVLRDLVRGIADSWSGSDLPDWRENEYLRGQLELVMNTRRVRVPDDEDDDLDSEVLMDRIWTWVRHDGANTTIGAKEYEQLVTVESVSLLKDGVVTELPFNTYHADDWDIGFDEESSAEAWWIELRLLNPQDHGLPTPAVLSLSDVEALALADALYNAVRTGRKDWS